MAELDVAGVTNTFQSTANPLGFTHTPASSDPLCLVAVLIQGIAGGTDWITGVTYGGVALTRVVPTLGGGENNRCWVYALMDTSAIPTGAQTVSIAKTTGGNTRVAVVSAFGTVDTELIDDGTIATIVGNPSIALAHGGRLALDVAVLGSGSDDKDLFTVESGMVSLGGIEGGGGSSSQNAAYRPAGTADTTVGWTGPSDDVTMIAAAFAQLVAAPPAGGRSGAVVVA